MEAFVHRSQEAGIFPLIAWTALFIFLPVGGGAACALASQPADLSDCPLGETGQVFASRQGSKLPPKEDCCRPFGIHAVDESTGRGIPLVELRTVNNIRLVTDSQGWAAFLEPDLIGQEVFFHVSSHGYQYPADGFGYAGFRARVMPGETTTIRLKRINIAERLYRTTGQGIYRDSVLLGQPVPNFYRPLAGGVLGCDSVLSTIFRGKIYWFWGDTHRASYPLGNFWTTGATSPAPGDSRINPDVGIPLEYFVGEDGFVRAMAPIGRQGPVWLTGPVVLEDPHEGEKMYAHYVIVDPKSPSFEALERGLAVFHPESETFEKLVAFPDRGPFPDGAHPLVLSSDEGQYVYFCNPFPLLRVKARPAHLRDPSQYESYSPLVPGTQAGAKQMDRFPAGSVRWAWKAGTDFVGPPRLRQLVAEGTLGPQDAHFVVYDVFSGLPVFAHRGSMAWNDFRKCFVVIFTEIGGTSFLGEVWYAEGDSLLGPWAYAQKILTHDRYSFYNPKHHPFFDQKGGRLIYFEGTYSASFSGAETPTPYYDYNQIMYRLDLAEPRLRLPIPVYQIGDGKNGLLFGTRWTLPQALGAYRKTGAPWSQEVRFWAWDRPGEGFLPVYEKIDPDGKRRLVRVGNELAAGLSGEPRFYVLDPQATFSAQALSALASRRRGGTPKRQDENTAAPWKEIRPVLLCEYQTADGSFSYFLEGDDIPPGAIKTAELGKVLPDPRSWLAKQVASRTEK